MFENLRFSKSHRLLQSSQFQAVLAVKPPLSGEYYVLYQRPNGLTHSRLGILTSKRNLALAVLRNRVKRQAREAYRYHQEKLQEYDIVLVAKPAAKKASACELRQCLDRLFTQAAQKSRSS